MNAVLPGTTMGRTQIYPLFLSTLCAIALTFCSCTDESSGPAPPVTPDTTSHEFVWEVDTIPAFLTAKAMYGTSASNVYVVGYSTGGRKSSCWHWDGVAWTSIEVDHGTGDVVDIDGVDSTFIVFLGYDPGALPPYTGIHALDNGVFRYLPLPLGTRYRTCLRVVSRDEIYLGGADGIQRFNGTSWAWMLDSTDASAFVFQPRYIYKFPDGDIECEAPRLYDGEYLLHWQNGVFTIVDSFAHNSTDKSLMRFGQSVSEGSDGIYSCGYGGTYKRDGETWNRIHTEAGRSAHGAENNLLIVNGSTPWHYNGNTIQDLSSAIKEAVPSLRSIWVGDFIDGTIFLAGELRDVQRTPVIIRGRQKGE